MKFSVITINYNNRDGLRRTIESVICQTCRDFEYIIIDGGSTDGSTDVIKERSAYIDYWVSEPDKGIFNAMNKGIIQSRGEYLIFMNSGDSLYAPDVLSNVEPHLGKDILQGSSYHNTKKCYYYCSPNADTMRNLYESGLNHQACFIRRELFNGSLYDENYRIASDWLFFIRKLIFENCSFANIPVMVSFLEGDGVSETATEQNELERRLILQQLLPQRILNDYEHFKGKDSPILEFIPLIRKRYKLHRLIYHINRYFIGMLRFMKVI